MTEIQNYKHEHDLKKRRIQYYVWSLNKES